MPSNHFILCCSFSFCLQLFLASGSFLMSQLFASGGQSIGASASASILPMNIQGWFSLGWTGLIPCCPAYSQEFSLASKFESINFSVLSLPYDSALTSVYISIFIYSIHSHTYTHTYPDLLIYPSPTLPLVIMHRVANRHDWDDLAQQHTKPQIYFLHLWLCFCFVNKFICTICF